MAEALGERWACESIANRIAQTTALRLVVCHKFSNSSRAANVPQLRPEACRRDLPLARAKVAAVAVKNAASFGLSVRGDIDAIISLAYQPICNAEPQRDRGQAQQLCCVHAAKVEKTKNFRT